MLQTHVRDSVNDVLRKLSLFAVNGMLLLYSVLQAAYQLVAKREAGLHACREVVNSTPHRAHAIFSCAHGSSSGAHALDTTVGL